MSLNTDNARDTLTTHEDNPIETSFSEIADALETLVVYTESLEAGMRAMLEMQAPQEQADIKPWIRQLVEHVQTMLAGSFIQESDIVGSGYVSEVHAKLRVEREANEAAELTKARTEGRLQE